MESPAICSSENESDSEPEFESIIATRARRSNAGSRLRQLINLEETNTGLQAATEDDENVNLLFEEDEDDQEFLEFENSDDENDITDKEQEENDEKVSKKSVRKSKTLKVINKEEAENDEMLSNSDISDSDSDEEEGERELQHQEKLKKRRKRKANLIPGVTTKKQKTITTPRKPKSANEKPKSDLLDTAPIALTERRHSSRKATIKNSIETHEKIEKEFEKRQSTIPVARKQYIEKTLEERLEEAKITEKANVLSLTNFYQQEVQKKKKQRDLANARKFKMIEFIRFWSKKLDITPLDEINEIEEEKQKMREEEEKKARRKLQYLKRKQARLGIKNDDTLSVPLSKSGKEVTPDAKTVEENKPKEDIPKEDIPKEDIPKEDTPKEDTPKEDTPKEDTPKEDTPKEDTPKEDTPKEDVVPDDGGSPKKDTSKDKGLNENMFEELTNETKDINFEEPLQPPAVGKENESIKEVKKLRSKSVQFSEEVTISEGGKTKEIVPLINSEDVAENTNIVDETKPELVYEGPFRRVTRNYVMFEEFMYDLTPEETKEYLFGKQSLLSGSRRDPKCETISIIKRNETSTFDLQKIQALRNESFKQLLKLPKFGEKIEITNNNDGKLTLEENELVRINTPAPVGVNLPNGQKKTCLITGEPAMYYDPTNGVPYATVDAFRILKNIVDGEHQWLQLDNGGINSRFSGGIGCYISTKNQRHANGVPDGF